MLDASKALTVIAEIEEDRRRVLDERLQAIAADLDGNPVFRPQELPHTHFMRFVVIEKDGAFPALLAWETNHDRDAALYLADVLRAAPSIDRVFECCAGYPADGNDEARAAWLVRHSVRAAAFYTGYRGVPHDQVVNDAALHEALREAIDKMGGRTALEGRPPAEVRRYLCDEVRKARPELDVSEPPSDELRWKAGWALAAIIFLALLPLLIVIGIPWYLYLRYREERDREDAIENTRPVHDDKELARFEDLDGVRQNQLTHLVDIKPGWFRFATLCIVLFALDVIARVHSVRGHLGGIISIHFARWVIIRDRWSTEKKRHRVLFFSNYDGSWESYLGEFVDRAAFGLTGVWSNTVEFPKTRRLLGEGARDEEAFKQWTRRHQIKTQVWWSGVPKSTVQNVRDDVWLRCNFERRLSDNQVNEWLRRI
jgi:hypothetical protein